MNKGISTKIRIGEKVQKWKSRKEYLIKSIRLIDVCEELKINRTYMSNYINETYHKNFNTWINGMRIKEAMRIMHSNPHLSLNEISKKVGYADLAHFSKQFKLITGVSPSIWKRQDMKSSKDM